MSVQVAEISIPANTTISVEAVTGWTLGGELAIQSIVSSVDIVNSLGSTSGYRTQTGATTAPTKLLVESDVFVRNKTASAVSVVFMHSPLSKSGPISATFVY